MDVMRVIGSLGVCAVVALGLLGVHSAETGPVATTARHSVTQAVTS